jgi:colanic acid/amylovoran biosynthesis protein
MNKVLLFACVEKNIGDDMFVYLVSKRYPNTELLITSDANYGSLAKLSNLKFSVQMKKWIWASSIGEKSRVKRMIGALLQKIYETELKNCLLAVYIVGNAFKNTNYIGKVQTRWIKERVKLTSSFYLLSTNFGPFYDNRWIQDCTEVFADMKDVCFRDQESFSYFKQLDCARCEPDAVFSLGKQKNSAEKILLISVLDFAFSVRNEKLHEKAELYEKKMAEIANGYILEGYKVVLLNSNVAQDIKASENIISQIKNQKMAEIVNYVGDLDVIFELYEHVEAVVATRLHTIVLAFLYGIPVIPIEYDIKVTNLLKMCGFDGCSIGLDNIDMIDYKFIKQTLSEYTFVLPDEIIRRSNEQFKKLDEKLN